MIRSFNLKVWFFFFAMACCLPPALVQGKEAISLNFDGEGRLLSAVPVIGKNDTIRLAVDLLVQGKDMKSGEAATIEDRGFYIFECGLYKDELSA
ncbi:hypothetical protein ACFLU6_02600, partial [Acidobacteriota bacterium]